MRLRWLAYVVTNVFSMTIAMNCVLLICIVLTWSSLSQALLVSAINLAVMISLTRHFCVQILLMCYSIATGTIYHIMHGFVHNICSAQTKFSIYMYHWPCSSLDHSRVPCRKLLTLHAAELTFGNVCSLPPELQSPLPWWSQWLSLQQVPQQHRPQSLYWS